VLIKIYFDTRVEKYKMMKSFEGTLEEKKQLEAKVDSLVEEKTDAIKVEVSLF
jgi:hypothetical protein